MTMVRALVTFRGCCAALGIAAIVAASAAAFTAIKLAGAVFFVALFPQFVPRGTPILPAALGMVGVIVACDLAWYSLLAALVSRAKRRFIEGRWARRVERVTGAVLIGLGVRLALEPR